MKAFIALKIASLGFTFLSFVICLLIWGQLVGFRDGAKWGNRPGRAVMENPVVLSGGVGATAYDLFLNAYALIAVCLCIFAVSKLYEARTVLFRALGVGALGIIVYKYWQLIDWKNLYLQMNDDAGYYYWIIQSIPFDWFCLTGAVLLLIVQIAVLIVPNRFISVPTAQV